MVIKKEGNSEIGKIEQIKLPKWLDNLITKKWFLYLFTAVVLVMVIGFSLLASTRDNIADAVLAKTATDVSVVKPPSGVENPLIIGTATPTQNSGQETTVSEFYNKFGINIYADIGKTNIERVAAINNIPQKIPLGEKIFLTNLKISPEKISGYIDNRDISTHRLRLKIIFYPDGKIIDGKTLLFAVDGDQIDIYNVMPGEVRYFEKSPSGAGSKQGRKIFDGLKETKFIAVGVELH